jgi:hypothetical protein
MAFDETALVEKVRQMLSERSDVAEKRIVGGGQGFMVRGHLCCGVSARGLTVRVGPEGKTEAVGRPHVGPLVLGQREARAFVVVEPEGLANDSQVRLWLDQALRFVESLG